MTTMLTTDTTNTLGAQYDDIIGGFGVPARLSGAAAHVQYWAAAQQFYSHRADAGPSRVRWRRDLGDGTNYKNAITNALYVVLSARLAV